MLKRIFIAVAPIALVIGLAGFSAPATSQVTPEVTQIVNGAQEGAQSVPEAKEVKVSVTNKKPCRTKKSKRCTWANSYHYGDTLSWWRGTGNKWNISDKRARDRLQTFFHAMYGEHAGALKFGGTLHPYCWWNDQGTAVLCGDGARKRY